jgi:hypothetical protein
MIILRRIMLVALLLTLTNLFSEDIPVSKDVSKEIYDSLKKIDADGFFIIEKVDLSVFMNREPIKLFNIDNKRGLPSIHISGDSTKKIDFSFLNNYNFFFLKIEAPDPDFSNTDLKTCILDLEETSLNCFKSIKNNNIVKMLSISDQENIDDFSFLDKFTALKILRLGRILKLDNLSFLKNTNVECLFLSDCPQISSLSDLKLSNVKMVSLFRMQSLNLEKTLGLDYPEEKIYLFDILDLSLFKTQTTP